MKEEIKVCTRCVMDTSDHNIVFNKAGLCNHCIDWFRYNNEKSTLKDINPIIAEIKSQKNQKYDCLLGLSGGVDSSYIAHLVKNKFNLNPLIVHLDNGWNSEIGINNIKKIIEKNKFDLYTYVIDWEEFRQMQVAYLEAGVVDIEAITDHAIHHILYRAAKENNIKYILKGFNTKSEFIMPKNWTFNKLDFDNIIDIVSKNSTVKMKTFPLFNSQTLKEYNHILKSVNVFDYHPFEEGKVKEELAREYDWQPYDGKHYESIFTRFYQAFILPEKFNIDKRKAHYSNLICMNEMSREEALKKLKSTHYNLLDADYEYVLEKLEIKSLWFEYYLKKKPVSHFAYKTNLKSKLNKLINVPNMFLNKLKYI